MRSIRAKTTLFTVIAIIISMTAATVSAAVAINKVGNDSSSRILQLLCETGQKNLDHYFTSIEQSAETVFNYIEDDLENTSVENLGDHLDRVKEVFEITANHTAGILTYYYRIDPTIETEEKGFWFVKKQNGGFYEHEVTDITLYDTEDQSALVWFTKPKAEGHAVWLPPYVTENLDECVLSYNIPIYKRSGETGSENDTFIGVIGIEISYDTIVSEVNSITLYENGYAFINDDKGTVIYHPKMDTAGILENQPKVPDGLISKDNNVRYTFEGVKKQAVWLPLSNGMRLNVTVPISEINTGWQNLLLLLILVSLSLLVIFIFLAMRFASRISKPLLKLTEAAEQVNEGNYNVDLTVTGNDETALLTDTFIRLINHLKVYINDLNFMAYRDALTQVHNKSAYDMYVQKLQDRMDALDPTLEFAVAVFDCDNLKLINDQYGHDKGDKYLIAASSTICHTFKFSPVFRTGGDEFTAILQSDDYRNIEANMAAFKTKCRDRSNAARYKWEQVNVSMGVARYERASDFSVMDIMIRADKLMYEDKRGRKAEAAENDLKSGAV